MQLRDSKIEFRGNTYTMGDVDVTAWTIFENGRAMAELERVGDDFTVVNTETKIKGRISVKLVRREADVLDWAVKTAHGVENTKYRPLR